jgi:hypothetical protein
VRDREDTLRAFDVATGTWIAVSPPGFRGALIAYLPGDLVIYQSRPTQGRPVIRSPYGSFRAGIQMLPIKISDLSTGRFQTIIEAVDPRNPMAFGETR